MNNVVSINTKRNVDIGFINNIAVVQPKTQHEYLMLCKRFLTEDDYFEICACILDNLCYNEAESQIQKIVDCYFTFPN